MTYQPSIEEKEIVINALYEFVIPRTNGQTVDEVATILLTRLHDRNEAVTASANRPRAQHPSETI